MSRNYASSMIDYLLRKNTTAVADKYNVRNGSFNFFLKAKQFAIEFFHSENEPSKPDSIEALAELYGNVNGGLYRERTSKERLIDQQILSDIESGSIETNILNSFLEADNNVHVKINSWLRRGAGESCGARLSSEMHSALQYMNDYHGIAYRSITVPANVYGRTIREGDILADKGIVSAFALPQNAIHWMEFWLEKIALPTSNKEYVIFAFDRDISKKKAAGPDALDNVLIKPGELFRVDKIKRVDEGLNVNRLKIVYLGLACNQRSKVVKDIYSGSVLHVS